MAKADIELLFGVAGGGSVSGASGAQIKGDLDAIVNAINAKPYDIKIQLDQQSVSNFKNQLADLTKYAQDQAKGIRDAYKGIQFPTLPSPSSGGAPGDPGKKNSGRKTSPIIGVDTSEMRKALSTLSDYQLKVNNILKSSSAASNGKGKELYKDLQDINDALKIYKGMIEQGGVSSAEFSQIMEYVSTTVKRASSEFKLLGENFNNDLIPKDSIGQLEGLTDIQKYRKQIKQMQSEWVAAQAPGAKSSRAMASLAAEATKLESLEKSLRQGAVGASDLANELEHAGAVIKQVTAEVKYFGEDRGLVNFKPGTEANVKALVELSKAISVTKKNYESWTAAAKGDTEGDYRGLKSAIDSFEQLHEEVKNGSITFDKYQEKFSGIKKNADQCSASIKAAGKDTKSLGTHVKDLVSKFSKWLTISQVVMRSIRTVRQMVDTVVEIDTAMTELRKVTDEAESAYDRFLTNSITRAKSLGATLTDVVSATADFAKLGKSIQEASELADAAIVYKNVGDNITDIGTAAESIISTMQAFSNENLRAMEIVDRFNSVGNNFAITSTGVGDALQRSAAAMNAAGNSLDETIALIAGANTIVQNPDSVGTTLKTVSMYLRAAKTEAEEAGESTDGMAESMSELRSEIMKLTGNKVDIQIDENTFKSTYQILKELSVEWENLTDISRANILEMIGGKRNANVVSSLLENFDVVERALKTSADSAGSALAENEKYLDSIQGKIQKFQAAWQALSSSIVSSDLVKIVVDASRLFVEGVTWMIDTLGGLSLAIGAVPIALFVSKLKPVAEVLTAVKLTGKELINTFKQYNPLALAANEAERALAAQRMISRGVIEQSALAMTGTTKKMREYISGLGVASAADLTFAQSIKITTMSLLEQAKAWALTPLGMATIAVTGIYALVKIVNYFNESIDRSRESLENLKNEYNNNESELRSLEGELQTTSERISELQGKGKLSFTEQEELSRLQAQNAELERSIHLLEAEQKLLAKEKAETFVDVAKQSIGRTYTLDSDYNQYDNLNAKIESYKQLQLELERLEKEKATAVGRAMDNGWTEGAETFEKHYSKQIDDVKSRMSDTLKYLKDQYQTYKSDMEGVSLFPDVEADKDGSLEAQSNYWLGLYKDFQDKLMIATGSADAKSDSFVRLINESYAEATKGLQDLGKEGKVTADTLNDPAYAEFVQKCIDIGIISDSSTDSLNFLAAGFNNLGVAVAGSVEGLSGTALTMDQINSGIDGTQERISALSDAFSKLRGGTMTLEEVIDLIQQFPELAEYVDLTAENFGDLDKGLQKLIRHSPDDLIDQLQNFKETSDLTDKQRESIDALCESMKKLSTEAIEDATGEFGMLAEAIQASKTAKNELDKALAEDDHDANYEDRIEAFKGLKEVMEKGEFGSKAFAAYKEYFDIGELDSSGVKNWIKQNSKYFDEGKAGVRNFLAEIERLNKKGLLDESIASYDSITKTFAYDITQIEAIGEAFGWSGEMVQDFVGKFRMYSEDFIDRTTEITQKELLMRDYIQDFGDVAITSMEELQAYTGYTEQGVRDLVDQMNALNAAVESELEALSAGGGVDLNLRPEIDTSELLKAGWEEDIVGEAGNIATVFSETFANKAKNVAINFTPIQVDENGNYIGTLSPKRFKEYCENVVSGVHGDYLNLQIGAEFTGKNAIEEAVAAANRIHELHAMLRANGEIKILGVDDIHITQATIDAMSEMLGSVEKVKEAIAELGKTEKVTFDAGISFNGQTVEEIIAEATGEEGDIVSVDVKLNINDEEIDVTLTTTEQRLNAINKEWEAILTGNTEDIEAKKEFVDALMSDLEENVTTVTVDGYTYPAVNGLKSVSSWIDTVVKKKNQTVTITYRAIGSILPFATGTKHAPEGLALLGDEYSPDGSPRPEMVISDGGAYIAGQDGPEIVPLNEGDQVLTYDQTKRILHGNPKVRKETIPAYANGFLDTFNNIKSSVSNLVNKIKNAITGSSSNKTSTSKTNSSNSSTNTTSSKKASTTSTSKSSSYTPNLYITNVVPSTGGIKTTTEPASYEKTEILKQATGYTANNPGGSWIDSGSGYGSGSGGSGSSGGSSDSSSKDEKSQFEKDYEYHQHLLAMEQESYENYIDWLENAYKDAYEKGQIELEDFYRYEEEVFEGRKELFQDALEDIEHKIASLEREPGNESQIINYYNQLISMVDNQLAEARARGLNDDDEYVQELLEQKWDYADEIKDIQEEITENAMDAVDDLIEYRIDMLKQDIESEKDALSDKLGALKDFYDEQKKMLQDVYDEEKYLEEQAEKRKSVDDIRAEMDMLKFDDSAKAQKRMLELQEELLEAEKELSDFEKDHALETTTDLLDKMYEMQESQIQSEIDALDARLNDPDALYNQALRDIQNNTLALYEEMLEYNNKYGDGNDQIIFDMWDAADKSLDAYLKAFGQAYKNILLVDAYKPTGYASGTSRATPGVHEVFEGNKDEYVLQTSDGRRYKMFSGLGDKVLNASATDFLYKFANNGESFLSKIMGGLVGNISNVNRKVQPVSIKTGDIMISGNADSRTVSEIRRAQRDNVDHILREFIKLNR